MVRNGASPISSRSPRQLPNGDSTLALFDKPDGGGTGLRRFDWPAFLRALGNRPEKSPQMKPRRSRTQQAFLKPSSTSPSSVHPTSDLLRSASGFRTPVQCFDASKKRGSSWDRGV